MRKGFMSWNYRVIEWVEDDGPHRAIHEVHYNKKGIPEAYSKYPAVIAWSITENPLDTFERMRKALSSPVLTMDDFDCAWGQGPKRTQ